MSDNTSTNGRQHPASTFRRQLMDRDPKLEPVFYSLNHDDNGQRKGHWSCNIVYGDHQVQSTKRYRTMERAEEMAAASMLDLLKSKEKDEDEKTSASPTTPLNQNNVLPRDQSTEPIVKSSTTIKRPLETSDVTSKNWQTEIFLLLADHPMSSIKDLQKGLRCKQINVSLSEIRRFLSKTSSTHSNVKEPHAKPFQIIIDPPASANANAPLSQQTTAVNRTPLSASTPPFVPDIPQQQATSTVPPGVPLQRHHFDQQLHMCMLTLCYRALFQYLHQPQQFAGFPPQPLPLHQQQQQIHAQQNGDSKQTVGTTTSPDVSINDKANDESDVNIPKPVIVDVDTIDKTSIQQFRASKYYYIDSFIGEDIAKKTRDANPMLRGMQFLAEVVRLQSCVIWTLDKTLEANVKEIVAVSLRHLSIQCKFVARASDF
jgi:hypothetical protein